ncbi:hypothetical protein SAMN02910275_01660 [Butyrivibrio sp. INlla18]|uniref:hypothetical protein n=1 Tax=Butyrivibrio sp. INlla18 TaxID=1520806 RepID=UPI0008869DF1|nr:hypothetical protein [Butyrivibrio sp. INlla18]SDA62124.1 hypothetical protein SAMN02910275_01660 [Butyrivibrio sp. INlla18]
MPEGVFVCYRHGKNTKWYQELKDSSGKITRNYISKKERKLATKLAQKTYYSKLLSSKKSQYENVKRFLKYDKAPTAYQLLEEAADVDHLLDEVIYKKAWEKEAYQKSKKYPEALKIKTKKGELVRSKSEAFIADCLFELNISYRYECEIDVSGASIYPDFTILHPTSKKIFIWEHLGLMDDPSYVKISLGKIPLYMSASYMPGVNLLLTYESEEHPLDYALVREMIQFYFL